MPNDRTFHFNEGCHVTFNDIHDNKDCTIITAEQCPKQPAVSLPNKNDYNALLEWLQTEKEQGRDWMAINNHNRSAMCRQLSDLLGWVVDQNSLRKAEQR